MDIAELIEPQGLKWKMVSLVFQTPGLIEQDMKSLASKVMIVRSVKFLEDIGLIYRVSVPKSKAKRIYPNDGNFFIKKVLEIREFAKLFLSLLEDCIKQIEAINKLFTANLSELRAHTNSTGSGKIRKTSRALTRAASKKIIEIQMAIRNLLELLSLVDRALTASSRITPGLLFQSYEVQVEFAATMSREIQDIFSRSKWTIHRMIYKVQDLFPGTWDFYSFELAWQKAIQGASKSCIQQVLRLFQKIGLHAKAELVRDFVLKTVNC